MDEVENSVSSIKKGDVVEGTVLSVDDKEAILDINYSSEGILERKELSNKNESPLNVLKIGDQIDVLVLDVDSEEG